MLQPTNTDAPSIFSARLMVAAAAVLWSTSGFFAKAPLFEDRPGPLLAFWRAVFASVLLMPQVRRPQWSWRLVPSAARLRISLQSLKPPRPQC